MNKCHLLRNGVLALIGGMLLISVSGMIQAESGNTVTYSGTLVALPCTVEPFYENLWVDFGGNLNAQDFYRGRGEYSDREFAFVLKDCDTSLGSAITATFSGDATPEGLLRPDSSSQASGIVIGLETLGGQPLPVTGQPVGAKMPLYEGDVTIRLRAYLQATPDALANHSIEPGLFRATLTYTLQYE